MSATPGHPSSVAGGDAVGLPPLKIGPYQLDSPFVLAPMAGVTDKPFMW